jgi:hypothetical protein
MRRPDDERVVSAMRNLLAEARVENSRMVAAAIGGHLSRITKSAGAADELGPASDVVRDASLGLLKALHEGKNVKRARQAALESVEILQAALPDPSSLTRLPTSTPVTRPTEARTKAIRDFARSRFSSVLPIWRT